MEQWVICRVFEVKYKSLYSAGSNDGLLVLLDECNQAILSNCSENLYANGKNHMHIVTDSMVKKAVKKLKMNKKDDHYIVCSNAFKNGPESIFGVMSFIFNCMIKFGVSNDIFDIITFVPIIKSSKNSKCD